jgi:hypothetical protein
VSVCVRCLRHRNGAVQATVATAVTRKYMLRLRPISFRSPTIARSISVPQVGHVTHLKVLTLHPPHTRTRSALHLPFVFPCVHSRAARVHVCAPGTDAGMTSHHAIVDRGQVKKGMKVGIIG